MRTVTRTVVLAFATGLTAGVVAGCQVYDFAPVRPLVISSRADLMPDGAVQATGFKQLVLDHLFD